MDLDFLGKWITAAGIIVAPIGLSGCGDEDGDGLGLGETEVETVVEGAPAEGEEVESTDIDLRFSTNAPEATQSSVSFECRHNQEQDFGPCSGQPYRLSGLKPGSEHELTVRAMIKESEQSTPKKAKEKRVKVKVAKDAKPSADADGDLNVIPLATLQLDQAVALGKHFSVKIPQGMHVTEFATTSTRGFMTAFFVLPSSDPNYIGNESCDGRRDRLVQSLAPAGHPYTYCQMTPERSDYTRDNEYRLARNHVEIASDADVAEKSGLEVVSFSAYAAEFDWGGHLRSFSNLCSGRPTSTISAPLVPAFYAGEAPQRVDLTICETLVSNPGGGLELWKVAGFRHCAGFGPVVGNVPTSTQSTDVWGSTSATAQYGSHDGCSVRLDVTYMAKPQGMDMLDEYFARRAQERLIDSLMPMLQSY